VALSVTEATAVNTLINYLVGRARPGHGVPTVEDAAKAAADLAGPAYKKLMAGLTKDEARELVLAAAIATPKPSSAPSPAPPVAPPVALGLFPLADPVATPPLFALDANAAGE
jgi:hypothetical protein